MWVMFDNDDQDIDVAKDIAKAIAELKIEFSGLAFSDNVNVGTVLFCLVCMMFLFQGFDTDRAKEAFDSFVAEKLLVAKMPGVIHWAVRYGSPLSLDHLLRDGANLEDKDKVMSYKRSYYLLLKALGWVYTNHAMLKSGKFKVVGTAQCKLPSS